MYFSLDRGGFRIQRILRKLRKVEVATIFYTLLFFVTFWFASLTRRGLRIQQIQRKWRKLGAATIFRISRFISASFLSSLTRRGLRIQLIPWKVRKKVPFPRFTIFPYVFITCQNGRCKTHCIYSASWRRSITRIESRNRINISTVIEELEPTWELVHIYLASARSIIEYAAPAWSFPSTGYLIAQLEAIQRRVLRIIFPCFEYADALKMANIPTIEQRLTISMSYFKQMKSNEHKLNHLFPQHYQNQYSTRSQTKGIVAVPQARTKRAANSFIIKASRH